MANNTYLPPSPVIPQILLITAITNADPMQITVSTENSYVVGQLAHLTVPESYGMNQADQLTGKILTVSIDNLNFTVNIDSTNFLPFVVPAAYQAMPATIAPAGARNIYNIDTVPFKALDGTIGN